ncbi:hypothetical protein KQ940_06605 [Marinobacterium sp. D7]|uniref:hypothetical protein n=1 Tax=Marinobacterium ramblicola TaxID=2849041 RepID=UPI001C2D8937|nr:hypothetical protein [Marinobacterium ramblicola]MBV1787724.1 hypothetical protein [Marinobacterium ramblicola]
MTVHRKIALQLHALNKKDSQWILDQLGARDRDSVAVLLDELVELGIPRDQPLLTDSAIEELIQNERGEEPSQPSSTEAIIARAGTEEIVNVLSSESDDVIGLVLSISDWPWLPAFLDYFREPRRTAIRNASSRTSVISPKVKESLLDALLLRLNQTERRMVAKRDHGQVDVQEAAGGRNRTRFWRALWRR